MPLIEEELIHLSADPRGEGKGGIVFSTGGVERARIKPDGTTTWPALSSGSQPATLPNWYRKLGSDAANAVIVFSGDSTSYEPNDQRLFVRFRPNVTTTTGSHTLPTGTINVASSSGFPASGTAVVGGQNVAYTGTGATTLTGCTGGSGVIAAGTKVVSPTTYDTIHTAPGGDLYGMTADDSHIVNGGNNGVKLADWLTGSGTYTLTQLIAAAPDLIVFDWGINDIRLNVDTYQWQTLRDLIVSAVTTIRAALPNADLILRMAGPASTDDTSSLHYIQGPPGTNNPAGGAQAFTDIMRKAYRALVDKWPNVVVWDSQRRVFGEKAIASTSTNLWSTQIHPSAYGYALTADYLVNDCIALPDTGRRFPALAPHQDFGPPVGDGIATTTATPYTVDQEALDDTNVFQLVYAGEYNTQTATTLLVGNANNVVDWPFGYPLDVQNGDVVRLPEGTCYKISGATVTTQASGASIPNLLVTGQSVPANTATNGVVRVYRELSQGDRLLAKIGVSPGANRYLRRGRIQAATASSVTIQAEPVWTSRVPSGLWAVDRANDKLRVAGYGSNPIAFTSANPVLSGEHLQLTNFPVDLTAYVGRIVLIEGSHAGEIVGNALTLNRKAYTAAHTLRPDDYLSSDDATSAAYNVTLPTAVGRNGQVFTIKKIDASANAVTVTTTSSQTVDGATTYALASQWKYVTVVSNGATWEITANN